MPDSLTITKLETFIVDGGWRNWVFIRIATDAGIDGWGECTLESREQAVAGAVNDMTRRLIGSDPAQIRGNLHRLARDGYWGSGPVTSSALGGIDHASPCRIRILFKSRKKSMDIRKHRIYMLT